MRTKLTIVFSVFVFAMTGLVFLGGPGEAKAEKEPIRIGAIYDFTGGLSVYGKGSHMTAKAAVEKINEEGGINGRKIEYIVEDGQTSASTGIRKFKKLVMKDKCDFVLLSCNSGMSVGVIPLAKRMNTIVFSEGTARSITGEKGNRYVFRQIANAEMAAQGMAKFAKDNLGAKAYGMGADYEWGHSVLDTAEEAFKPMDIELLDKVFSPIETADFVPYLNEIPEEANFIVAGYFTSDVVKLVNQAYDLGIDKPFFVGTLEGIKYEDLGKGADNVWCGTYGGRAITDYPENVQPFQKEYRERVGLNKRGWDSSGDISAEYIWGGWEGIHWIKKGIEESGWKKKDKENNLKFMKALEGAEVEASLDFPTGGKKMRAEDHQAMSDIFIIKGEDGEIITKDVIEGEELADSHTADADFTKEKVE